jgi:hypothetical protein
MSSPTALNNVTTSTTSSTEPIKPSARRSSTKPVWTVERIRALGAATNLTTAASILGISRSQAYRLVATGTFPAPVIKAGSRIIVPVAALLRLLLIDGHTPETAPGSGRLDHPAEASVDALSTHPADYTRHRWRTRPAFRRR